MIRGYQSVCSFDLTDVTASVLKSPSSVYCRNDSMWLHRNAGRAETSTYINGNPDARPEMLLPLFLIFSPTLTIWIC